MKNATINEVAELAGVSIATVSRVLNARPNVRDTTKKKINTAIATLNFKPDEGAREMAFRRASMLFTPATMAV
jgi:LacI family transcriptional regulator